MSTTIAVGGSDKFWEYFDSYADGYRELTDALTKEFGVQFQVWHTGGGCYAIESGPLEGGYNVIITDAAEILSHMRDRNEMLAKGIQVGYGVGVYPLEPVTLRDGTTCMEQGECCGWASSPTAETPAQVVTLVKLALESVATFKADRDAFTHIDPALLEGS
jgi:hypothetical protein